MFDHARDHIQGTGETVSIRNDAKEAIENGMAAIRDQNMTIAGAAQFDLARAAMGLSGRNDMQAGGLEPKAVHFDREGELAQSRHLLGAVRDHHHPS